MIRVDYTQLDKPVRLTLVGTPTGWYSVIDQHGSLYFPPTQDITTCLRFMNAMAFRNHATIDDASVERATWTAAQQHSVRVGALEEGETTPVRGRGNSPSSNVIPIRMHTQLDEPKTCKDCGDPYINWGAHAERCYGRPRKVKP